MTLIRKKVELNANTFLIDTVHEGLKGGYAVFLIKSSDGETCLIDGGTRPSAPHIHSRLKALGGWPPRKIIISHSHWDHTQAIPFLRDRAAETGDHIEVLASEKALPYLKDQSFNTCFEQGQDPFLNIENVVPLKDGDRIKVGGDVTLEIIETPGHMIDHISILDHANRNIFVGDAIGTKWADGFMLCNANSPYWDEAAYLHTIDRLKGVDFDTICLSHFGCVTGDEAQQILDESVTIYRQWMDVLGENSDRLDDVPFLIDRLWERMYTHITGRYREILPATMTDPVRMAAGVFKQRNVS